MREAINLALSQADSAVSKLTIEQDSLNQKISKLKEDNEFLERLIAKNEQEIQDLRRTLETERAALEIESRELKELLR
jgi:predicted  nucleic acid-binding Zn-ribbon protein